MIRMKLCPKCQGIMDEDLYFGKWICIKCDYREPIKNNQWIEELTDKPWIINGDEIIAIRKPELSEVVDKINEIIKVINKITNPRV